MTAEETVLDYYEALRRGEPLYPYFAEGTRTWKGAISTDYDGSERVAEALREQTRLTDDWTVESNCLSVTERESFAAFHDRVDLAWTATRDDERYAFETRWSGALVPVGDGDDRSWEFLQLHVSAPHDL